MPDNNGDDEKNKKKRDLMVQTDSGNYESEMLKTEGPVEDEDDDNADVTTSFLNRDKESVVNVSSSSYPQNSDRDAVGSNIPQIRHVEIFNDISSKLPIKSYDESINDDFKMEIKKTEKMTS